ncbi:MAG: pilus assembly protein TadG-related protein [Candidatus Paracaedibacter sp.]
MMIRSLTKKIKSFHHTEKGAVLIFVGLCLLPMLLMLGLAVDSSYGLAEKRKLQMAVDAAAKAGAANGNGVSATITSEAQKMFAANTANMTGIAGPNISTNLTAGTVTVNASILVSNVFMTMAGKPTSTYNASATTSLSGTNFAEVAIVYELSTRFQGNGYHANVCNALINFVNSLPNNVMVSITPIATDIMLDSTTTMPGTLFNHLSTTTNDESVNPAFYALGPTLAWTSANFNLVTNIFYTNGSYADFPVGPNVLVSNPSPGTCTIPNPDYPSCSTVMWPLKCPSTTKTSCSQVYSYQSNTAFPVLPLTANKTLLVNYITAMKNYTTSADGLFPSLISWGWRTIDPAWNDFWMVNANLSGITRSTGIYPKPYGGKQKSMIVIFYGDKYWSEYSDNAADLYVNPCGDATKVVNGLNHWSLTYYGIIPVPTDYQSKVNDITCENRWYKTMDKGLGLNLSDSTNYNATVSSSAYSTPILNEISAKFFRICSNIKAKNVDIYLLSNSNTSTLASCCNTSANAYTITNSNSNITTKLTSVKNSILAKIS